MRQLSHCTQFVGAFFWHMPQGQLTFLVPGLFEGPGLVSVSPASRRKMHSQCWFLRVEGGNLGEKMVGLNLE